MTHEKSLYAIELADSFDVLIVFFTAIVNLLPTKILTRYDSITVLCRLIVLVSSFYGSVTNNESTYLGSGDAAVDAVSGIVACNNVIKMPEKMGVLAGNWVSGPYVAGVSAKYTGERDACYDNAWKADGY